MRQQTVTLGANKHIYPQFPFFPKAIEVNNHTGSYLLIVPLGQWVKPYELGRVLSFDLQQAQVEIRTDQTPDPTLPPPPSTNTQPAELIFYDEPVPEQNGTAYQTGSQLSQRLLAPLPNSCAAGTCHYPVPSGTHSLAFITTGGGAFSIIGDQSNNIYFTRTDPGARYYIIPVDSSVDTTVAVGNLGGTFFLTAVMDVQAMFIVQNPDDVFNIYNRSLWAGKQIAPFRALIANGAHLTLAAKGGGSDILLWRMHWQLQSAVNIVGLDLNTDTGVLIDSFLTIANQNSNDDFNYEGLSVKTLIDPAFADVRISNGSGVAVNVAGVLFFDRV